MHPDRRPKGRPHGKPKGPSRDARPFKPLDLKADDPSVVVSRKGQERITRGQPWIYKSDVDQLSPGLTGGASVKVLDSRSWFLARAFYSDASQISLRVLSREDMEVDRDFLRERLHAALELRQRAFPGVDAYRWVHGEADGLPGLVVDRYGDHLSVQFLAQAMEVRRELVVELLEELLKPACIVERSDVKVRAHENLPQRKGVLRGAPRANLTYKEGDVELGLDLLEGQKTGTFLDQRENHILAGGYARGRCLDCFSYVGGFALQMAKAGGDVTAVEISEQASALIKSNAERNSLRVNVVTANAFDFLRDQLDAGERYDTIVLDPPAFAKSKDAIDAAIRGYKEINLRAMQLLQPNGILITASCSYHVDEAAFEALLADAAADAKKNVQIVERRGAGRDHPVLVSLRETRYLKCYVLRVLG
ncbi:MAG: class I SAM-dependent rRNA methyltransferase [Deltaproteobacteria bacterium]|nr:class I SAM-dependent rRNA methyltransferase [Deltaproteobacteria bacterium]